MLRHAALIVIELELIIAAVSDVGRKVLLRLINQMHFFIESTSFKLLVRLRLIECDLIAAFTSSLNSRMLLNWLSLGRLN